MRAVRQLAGAAGYRGCRRSCSGCIDLSLVRWPCKPSAKLEDSYDWPGMMQIKSDHAAIFQKILDDVRLHTEGMTLLALSAGCCNIDPCTYPECPAGNPKSHGSG